MSKAEERALEYCCIKCQNRPDCGLKLSNGRNCIDCTFYLKGYHQAIADACEWIKQQQEMLDDCFSDAGDFADLLKEAIGE